jgi:hypothetical protein
MMLIGFAGVGFAAYGRKNKMAQNAAEPDPMVSEGCLRAVFLFEQVENVSFSPAGR